MPGLYTGATGLWGGFAGLLYGSSALSTPPGLLADAGGFTPASLFASGEQGVWYDPSDMTTLFQNAAGTTPVTAVEQPVGLMLDKSQGLVLGSELATSPDLSWDASVAVDSAVLAPVVSGKWYRFEWAGLTTTATTGVNLRVVLSAISPNFPVNTSTATSGVIYFVAPTTGNLLVYAIQNANNIGSFSSVSVRELPGNHATQSTPTARPVLKQDANGKYYLFFDGTDDGMATATINPGSVDKAQVFAGVRKLSDAAQGVLAEWSATIASNNGTFLLAAPDGATATFGFDSKGTTQVDAVASGQTAPLTAVLSGLADISGDIATIRVNGAQADQDTGDQGTGNYLSYPLYIGRRGGTSLPFNGHLYSLIARFGANLPNDTIAQTETWVNGKTGAY